jgi:hypothetical protein
MPYCLGNRIPTAVAINDPFDNDFILLTSTSRRMLPREIQNRFFLTGDQRAFAKRPVFHHCEEDGY